MNRYINVSEDAVRGIFKKLNHKNIYPKSSDEIILRNYLDEFPTADVVEVVHGEWIVLYDEDSPQDGIWKCSECDYIRFVDDISPTNYCPNCGAKMDGKK